jgi:hypothetical protein
MQQFYSLPQEYLNCDLKKKIILECKDICTSFNVDELDCNKSWCRVKSQLSFEDIILKLDTSCHFVIILRDDHINGQYGEIGFSTLTSGISYYLFIFITKQDLLNLVDKYNLRLNN